MTGTDYSTEEWRDIPGLEGMYQASSFGRIRSLDMEVRRGPSGKHLKKGRILSPCFSQGYPAVNIRGTRKIHRLVCMAFHGMPVGRQEVLHGDGTRTNNRSENLRWGSRQENIQDAQRHGVFPIRVIKIGPGKVRGPGHPHAKLSVHDVLEVKRLYSSGGSLRGISQKFKVQRTTIRKIIRGETWAHIKDSEIVEG